jgi:hypothetical protein
MVDFIGHRFQLSAAVVTGLEGNFPLELFDLSGFGS